VSVAKRWTAVLGEAKASLAESPRLRSWWRLAAAVAVIRLCLLGVYMIDAHLDVGALPGDPFYRSHSCLTAYWRAATLARAGEANLYDPALYEDRRLEGFDVDAYVYPPPFLLWPAGAAVLSNEFKTIRTAWFVVELGLFLWAYGSVAAWIGGRSGGRCLLWLPVVATGLPVLLGMQMGNFHLAAIALAIMAMLAVEEGRPGRAGFWMAVAAGSKLFPVILLVALAGRRKPIPILWTIGWLAILTTITVIVFGTAPLASFSEFQLPRLVDSDRVPWTAPGLFGTVNSSIVGLALKLRAIGVPLGPLGSAAARVIYAIVLLTAALAAGPAEKDAPASPDIERRDVEQARLGSAQSWLAFLALASMGAPFLPDAYGGAVALWLLALVAANARRRQLVWTMFAFVLLWPVLPSRIAAPGFEPLRLVFTLAAQLMFLALTGNIAWRAARRWVTSDISRTGARRS
jgi:uncharacterized membrane protein YuzA (DUF378 family)